MSERPVTAVLGAAGGVGAACVRALLWAGSDVVVAGRTLRTLEALRESSTDRDRVAVCPIDLATADDGDTVVSAALTQFGRLDGLVNTAAVYLPAPAIDLTRAHWEEVMVPNLRGAIVVTSSVAAHLAEQGRGRIVQVTSITADVSRGDYTVYEASKAGLAAATRSMAVELAPRGVVVNAVAPGWVRTPMSAGHLEGIRPEQVAGLIPLRRVGEPEEIAAVVTWLLLESPAFLLGQTIVVDGGQTAFTAHL